MPIQADWLNENHRVIVYRFSGSWTRDDLLQQHDKIMPMVEAVDHRVDFLIDLRENTQSLPRGIFDLAQEIAGEDHPNLGYYAFLGGWSILSILVATLRRLDNRIAKRAYFVKSEDEALQLFQNLEM